VPVVTLDVTHRSPFMEDRPFGDVGPYQWLEGTVYFVVDPLHPCNTVITDLELAPRDATGKVAFRRISPCCSRATPSVGIVVYFSMS